MQGVYMSGQPETCTWAILGDSGLMNGLLGVHDIYLILALMYTDTHISLEGKAGITWTALPKGGRVVSPGASLH